MTEAVPSPLSQQAETKGSVLLRPGADLASGLQACLKTFVHDSTTAMLLLSKLCVNRNIIGFTVTIFFVFVFKKIGGTPSRPGTECSLRPSVAVVMPFSFTSTLLLAFVKLAKYLLLYVFLIFSFYLFIFYLLTADLYCSVSIFHIFLASFSYFSPTLKGSTVLFFASFTYENDTFGFFSTLLTAFSSFSLCSLLDDSSISLSAFFYYFLFKLFYPFLVCCKSFSFFFSFFLIHPVIYLLVSSFFHHIFF